MFKNHGGKMLEDKLKKQVECIKLLSEKIDKDISQTAIIWAEEYAEHFNEVYSRNPQLNYQQLYNLTTSFERGCFEKKDK